MLKLEERKKVERKLKVISVDANEDDWNVTQLLVNIDNIQNTDYHETVVEPFNPVLFINAQPIILSVELGSSIPLIAESSCIAKTTIKILRIP